MNARQAKKAFKKKYGVNPKEAVRLINEVADKIPVICEKTLQIANEIMERINNLSDEEKEMILMEIRKGGDSV